jgi:hypothetical protein
MTCNLKKVLSPVNWTPPSHTLDRNIYFSQLLTVNLVDTPEPHINYVKLYKSITYATNCQCQQNGHQNTNSVTVCQSITYPVNQILTPKNSPKTEIQFNKAH